MPRRWTEAEEDGAEVIAVRPDDGATAVDLAQRAPHEYRAGRGTIAPAAELAGVVLREMLPPEGSGARRVALPAPFALSMADDAMMTP